MSEQWFLDQARLGNMYHAHNVTAGSVTVIAAITTGLALENPHGSGVDLVVSNMSFVGSTLSTIREIGIACNANISTTVGGSTTADVIHNARNEGSNIKTGKGLVYRAVTWATAPVWIRPIGSARVTGAVEGANAFEAKFDGTLIVPPGGFVCFATLTAAAVGLCSISWAEAPIIA